MAAQPPAKRPTPETIDPKWLLKAAAAMFGLGVCCAYFAICGLFWLGQWQLVLHPARLPEKQPADLGLQAQTVEFGNAVKGWWIPAPISGEPTVLMLPSGDGNAGDSLAAAKTMHDSGLNVLLFDYRGYGGSSGKHPRQNTMRQDSEDALAYISGTSKAPEGHILVYGTGAGASLATRLCAEYPEIEGLVLQDADGDFGERARREASASVAPVRLLFHEDFPLADPLSHLATPKLIVSRAVHSAPEMAHRAASPKLTVELPGSADEHAFADALKRFLDTYVPQSAPRLQ